VLLARAGYAVNRKRVVRLLRVMGLEALYPRRALSQPGPGHVIYPYLLKDRAVTGPDQVWCADITYLPMAYGFMYPVAVMDWWSRYVLAWGLSNTVDADFCIRAWEQASGRGRQARLISNTNQGSQFASPGYIDAVESAGVEVSMDGRGRWLDNRFIGRLWWSARYEDIYRQDYGDGLAAGQGLPQRFTPYNTQQAHQSLENAAPAQWYFSPEEHGGAPPTWEAMKPEPPGPARSHRPPAGDLRTEELARGSRWSSGWSSATASASVG
jgi:putative transposase